MPEVEWSRLKAHELRALANDNAVVIIPVASIEQHGPHLPVMTDTRIGHEVALRAARAAYPKRPTIVTPVVWHGLSEHHMPFGGTLTLTYETFRLVLRDLVISLSRHGFQNIVLSNSHGGNIIALQQFCDEFGPTLPVTLISTTYVTEAGPAIPALLEDQDNVQHGGEAETSMMMVLEPDLVDSSDLAGIATGKASGFLSVGKASYRWRPFAHVTHNGLSGVPARSNADKGKALLDVSVQAIADLITDPDTWAPPRDLRGPQTGGVPFRS